MLFLTTAEQTVSNFDYWSLLFTVLELILLGFTAWCAYDANQSKKEAEKIENNITTNIQNAVEIAVKNEIQSTASATATASVTTIINDDEAIKRISAAVANELISKKTPKFTSKEGMLEMKIPDSSHSLRFEHK